MGNGISSTSLINFEEVQEKPRNAILIHIMESDPKITIHGTLSAHKETETINDLLERREYDRQIIVYGRNDHEFEKLINKQKQLKTLGFTNVNIYLGGMFEWLLLQDVYGVKEFPTHGIKSDPLLFKPMNI
jgi:hypothetical protein